MWVLTKTGGKWLRGNHEGKNGGRWGDSVAQQAWEGVGRSSGACSPVPQTRDDNKRTFMRIRLSLYSLLARTLHTRTVCEWETNTMRVLFSFQRIVDYNTLWWDPLHSDVDTGFAVLPYKYLYMHYSTRQ